MLEFTVTVSEADFFAANANVFFKGWTPRNVLFSLVCSTVMLASAAFVTADLAVLQSGRSPPPGWPTYELLALEVGAAFAVLFMATRFAICWFQLSSASNKQYALTGTMMKPTTYRLTPERFQSNFEEGSVDHPWSRFMDYVDAGSVLMLRRTPGFIYIISKHLLTSQQNHDLINLLDQVGVKRG